MIRVRSTETGVVFKSKAEAMRRAGFARYKLDKSIKQGVEVVNREGYTDRFELVDPQYEKENRSNTDAIEKQIKHTESEVRHREKELDKANQNLQKLLISDIPL